MHCQPDRGSASVRGVQHIVLKQIYLKSKGELYSLFFLISLRFLLEESPS